MYIGILQYIKSEDISIRNEISKILAGKNTNIRIAQFFSNSPDFINLQNEINSKKTLLESTHELSIKQLYQNDLKALEKMKREFQAQVLQMGLTIGKFAKPSEKIKKIMTLFEAGEFKKADALLKEKELSSNQFNLLIQIEYLEKIIYIRDNSRYED